MKSKIIALLLTITIICSGFTKVDFPNDSSFIQLLLTNQLTRTQVQTVNSKLRALPGVKIARLDLSTRMCLVIFDSSYSYDEVFVQSFFQKHNLQVRCSNFGVQGQDAIVSREDFICLKK